MKQFWSFLFFASVLLAPPASSLCGQAAPTVQAKHCLWKVQGKTNSVYLFGSIHFLKKEFYPLPAPIEEAYKKSGVVVFEIDLEESESLESQRKVAKVSKVPADETLKQHLSKATYDRLEAYLTNSGVPGNALDAYRPWVAAVALLEIELQKLGYNPKQGVDRYFQAKAEKDHKEVVALETLDFQLSLFTGLVKSEQEAMLNETLEEISSFKELISEMIRAWQAGEAETLSRFTLEHMRAFPVLEKKLLLDRNKNWVGSLEKLLQGEKDVFVVVGAAHMVGTDSVVDLLKKKGFKIEQL
ncbi:MAG: GumN family protein [Verrucomicrobiales bacterium]|nr:GumN family protein [Verrucomicrobiales bacterium]